MTLRKKKMEPAKTSSSVSSLGTDGSSCGLNFAFLLDAIGQYLFVVDTEGTIRFWNKALEKISFSREEVLGRKWTEIFPHLDAEDAGLHWRSIIEQNVIGEGRTITVTRHPFLRTPGARETAVFYDIQAFPVRDDGGQVTAAAILFEDVSERVRSEGRLIRASRSSGLADLASALAHEIKNPLNSISLNIQLLHEELAGKEELDRVETARVGEALLKEIQRLNNTLRDFMKFSRQPLPHLTHGDLNEPIRRCLTLLRPQAAKKKIQIIDELGTVPKVLIDPDQFQQAVYNILLNAIEAVQEGGCVGVASYLEGDKVLVRIFDNGPGIREEDHARIFDLFYSKGKEHGAGLGLKIANQIIENHQGEIGLLSAPGKGAAFTISLPSKWITPAPERG